METKSKKNNIKGVHIGEALQKKVAESGLTVSAFAEKINYTRVNVYHLFKRKTIESDTLAKASEILNFDFMSLYLKKDSLDQKPTIEQAEGIHKVNIELDLNNAHHITIFNNYMQGNRLKLR